MAGRNTSLINQLTLKNIKDTVILGIVTILIVAFIIYIQDKTMMISWIVITLLLYLYNTKFQGINFLKPLINLLITN